MRTQQEVLLENTDNDNIWNDSGSFKLDNTPIEHMFPVMDEWVNEVVSPLIVKYAGEIVMCKQMMPNDQQQNQFVGTLENVIRDLKGLLK